MIFSMDPLREAGLQDEVAGTSLVTRKFSSNIFFVGKHYTNFRRARARTPNASHDFRKMVIFARPLTHLI